MVEIVTRNRSSPVLTPSRLPCLRQIPTVNVTEGCSLGCTYCYIQGYPRYPGRDRVVLFANTPELVEDELGRRRQGPTRVYFSPSSDAFQPHSAVQQVAYETMSVLLDAGVEVAFLTKGFVTERFLRLFARRPEQVFAQVGMTTLDQDVCSRFEPVAAPPHERLRTINALIAGGVHTTVRLDPLIPDLTDTEANLRPVLESLRTSGVHAAAVSYLFLRNNVAPVGLARTGNANPQCWPYQRFLDGCGGGRMLALDERRRRIERIRGWADQVGIQLTSCRCKNPELGGPGCAIAGPPTVEAQRPDPPLPGFAKSHPPC